MINTIFAILAASSGMVLQLEEVKVNNINWGVYYNSDDLSCAVGSAPQGDLTVFLRRNLNDNSDLLVIGSTKWHFTYASNKLFSTTVVYSDGSTATGGWDYNLEANTNYMTVRLRPQSFAEVEKLTIQFNAKHRVTYDIAGIGKMQAAYYDCIDQMEQIHAEILADTEEEDNVNSGK